MNLETRLAHALTDHAAPSGHATLEDVMHRGRRRRVLARLTATLVAVAALGMAGLAITLLDPMAPTPEVAGTIERDLGEPVAIFLCDGQGCAAMTSSQRRQLQQRLVEDSDVATVKFESKQDAYDRFAAAFPDDPDLVASVDPEALPASFRVRLYADVDPARFVQTYRHLDGVEDVVVQPETEPATAPDS